MGNVKRLLFAALGVMLLTMLIAGCGLLGGRGEEEGNVRGQPQNIEAPVIDPSTFDWSTLTPSEAGDLFADVGMAPSPEPPNPFEQDTPFDFGDLLAITGDDEPNGDDLELEGGMPLEVTGVDGIVAGPPIVTVVAPFIPAVPDDRDEDEPDDDEDEEYEGVLGFVPISALLPEPNLGEDAALSKTNDLVTPLAVAGGGTVLLIVVLFVTHTKRKNAFQNR
jgi:hypothetical protein